MSWKPAKWRGWPCRNRSPSSARRITCWRPTPCARLFPASIPTWKPSATPVREPGGAHGWTASVARHPAQLDLHRTARSDTQRDGILPGLGVGQRGTGAGRPPPTSSHLEQVDARRPGLGRRGPGRPIGVRRGPSHLRPTGGHRMRSPSVRDPRGRATADGADARVQGDSPRPVGCKPYWLLSLPWAPTFSLGHPCLCPRPFEPARYVPVASSRRRLAERSDTRVA